MYREHYHTYLCVHYTDYSYFYFTLQMDFIPVLLPARLIPGFRLVILQVDALSYA